MLKLTDFYANWCGPCKMMESIFEELKQEFGEQVKFERVNVDEDTERATQYNVLTIPTFVIENDGKEVNRKVGTMGKEEMRNWLKQHI